MQLHRQVAGKAVRLRPVFWGLLEVSEEYSGFVSLLGGIVGMAFGAQNKGQASQGPVRQGSCDFTPR